MSDAKWGEKGPCANCGNVRSLYGRGLCDRCRRDKDVLAKFPAQKKGSKIGSRRWVMRDKSKVTEGRS